MRFALRCVRACVLPEIVPVPSAVLVIRNAYRASRILYFSNEKKKKKKKTKLIEPSAQHKCVDVCNSRSMIINLQLELPGEFTAEAWAATTTKLRA